MFYIKKIKAHIYHILAMAAIFLIIFGSGDSAYGNTYTIFRNVAVIIEFLAFGCIYLVRGKLHFPNFLIYIILSTIVILSMIINFDIAGYSMFLVLGIGLFISKIIHFDEFYIAFENCVFIIVIFSLIGLAVYSVCPEIVYEFPNLVGGGSDLKNLYVTTIPISYINRNIRNYGVFREPAMFSIYIVLALMRQLFYAKNMSSIRIVIYTIAIFSTLSMTGVLAYVFVFTLWVFRGSWDSKNKKISIIIFLFIICCFVFRNFEVIEWIQDRLSRTGSSSVSINSRIASITVNLEVFVRNILFGSGAIKSQKLFKEYLIRLGYSTNITATNMVMYLASSYGIFLISIFTIGIYSVGYYANKDNIKLGLLITIFMLLCGETLTYSSTMYIFMFYGIDYLLIHKIKLTI